MFSTWINSSWIHRQLPIWSSFFAVIILSGLLVATRVPSVYAVVLGGAGTAVVLFPFGFLVSLFVAFGFRGKNRRGVRESLISAFVRTDPPAVTAPFLIALQLLITFLVVWQVAAFSALAFKRQDLAALVVGASGIGGVLLSLLVVAALYPMAKSVSKKIPVWKAPWLPLATLFGSVIWSIGLLLIFTGVAAVLLIDDLRAAELGSVLALALIHIAFLGVLAWRLFKKKRAPESKPPLFSLVSISVGFAMVVAGMVQSDASETISITVGRYPAVGNGMMLGRRLTDIDRDGYSNLFGGRDCAAFDSRVYPGATEVPLNGIDENCSGADSKGNTFEKPAPRFVDPLSICPERNCNVVLITVDSLRSDQLTVYGSPDVYMPHLEALAKKSVVFHNAYTPGPGTILTIPSMLAGMFDSQLEMDQRIRGPLPVSRKVTLIQESLTKIGITCLAVLEHYYLDPLNQGWTKFYNPYSPKFYRESTVVRQVDKILEYIDAYEDKPFFLFAHLNEPHHNYLPHEGFNRFGGHAWGRYRTELAFTDHHLKRVFDRIDTLANRRPTLLIVSADHGEGLGQHGIRFHNGGFYRELVWVPLIAYHKAVEPRRLEEPVSLLDMAPTLRNLYGLQPAPQHVGTSLLGQIIHGDEYPDRTVYHQGLYDQGGRYYNLVGISNKRYRLLHDMRNQTFEFFDLQTDPREQKNLADENSTRFQHMKKELLDWLDSIALKSTFVHRDWEDAPPGAKAKRRRP